MGFSRQESWSGLPFPAQGGFLDPGIEPMSLMSLALAGGFFTTELSRKPPSIFSQPCALRLLGFQGWKQDNKIPSSLDLPGPIK